MDYLDGCQDKQNTTSGNFLNVENITQNFSQGRIGGEAKSDS